MGGYTTDVTVVSNGIPSPSVAADQFTYTSVLPVITSISPASGSNATMVKITGSHFTGATFLGLASWIDPPTSGSWDFTVVNDATISTIVPGWVGATSPLTYNLFVKNPYGWNIPDSNDQFRLLPFPPVPTITSVSPASGPATGGTTLLIKGSGFSTAGANSATGVFIGNPLTNSTVPASNFTVIDDSTISAVTPNVNTAAGGSISVATAVDVRVTTLGGTSALTPADQFTYLPTGSPTPTPTPIPSPTPTPTPSAPPTLSEFTPTSGAAGTLVTLTGTNLTISGAAEVLFTGCSAATAVPATAQADGMLTVVVPACAQTGPLTVFTAGGSATSAQSFTVI
jgi:hypothetical protein